jgi:rare lipoprotein A
MPVANRSLFSLAACLGVLLVQGCTTLPGPSEEQAEAPPPKAVQPKPDTSTAKKSPAAPATLPQTGEASWYGAQHHGRKTASGAVFDQGALTAAHPTLPFGTRVRVTNLANERAVEVEINDRGPFVGNRIIDLSQAAAKSIGMIGSGTANVRIEASSGSTSASSSGSTSSSK